MSSAISKSKQGIILNYFYMLQKLTVEVLGKPESAEPYLEDDQLICWKFDPVTLELYYHGGTLATVAYDSTEKLIRDNIEGRALKVYGEENTWKHRRR
ncbi:MAG: hypothetical protein CMI18_14155 [Opitutaceae bacterium]|nr:hypothetical protein [Opitutaceae bacterium]